MLKEFKKNIGQVLTKFKDFVQFYSPNKNKLDLEGDIIRLGKPFRENPIKILKKAKIEFKLPYVKKSPSRKEIFVQKLLYNSTLKLE